MQVDASLGSTTPSFSFPSSFEDFFNMDLVSTQSASSSSPSSSPRSPPGASSFPQTPPEQPMLSSFATYDGSSMGMGIDGNPSEFLNMYLDDDFSKPLAPSTASPFDFLGAFTALANNATTSTGDSTNSVHTMSPQDSFLSHTGDSPHFAIDPSLVDSPTAGHSHSNADADDEDDDDIEPEEVELIAPIKVGGKGKARKGTVASGGINKKSAPFDKEKERESVVSSVVGKVEDRDSDDWRPSPEEYKKMSSKEKRQLRNKISARNFRVRRKEYISTLEADISERDALISAIRSELGSSQSENMALRQEIATLKKNLLQGRGATASPILPPPAALPTATPTLTPAASTTAPAASTSGIATPPKSPLLMPNTQKDLPSSPRLGARPFWGGAAAGLGMGYTPVHTTFVPPLSMATGVSSAVLARKGSREQENINPNMNAPPPARAPSPPISNMSMFVQTPAKTSPISPNMNMNMSGFDAFADMNPFTLKTLDAYRMQLWGKMAAQGHMYQQQQQQTQQQQHQLSGLAQAMRPAFFRDAALTGTLSGKNATASTSAYPSPPSTPKPSPAMVSAKAERERDAMYVALASQTLLGKLGSAFWDAFSGGSSVPSASPSSSSSPAAKQWDAEKVRKVLEGKAVVRVVDVETLPTTTKASPKLASTSTADAKSGGVCMMSVTDILEESMRSLTLSKK